jgi:hypothetical protein
MPMEPGVFCLAESACARTARLRVGRANRAAPKARPGNQRARKHNRGPAAP